MEHGCLRKKIKTYILFNLMEKKICFIVIDGMNDLAIKELNKKTPLEIANTYTMDFLAAKGTYGLVKLFDFAPESDEAMMSLLSLMPEKNYPGRGILEAYGSGLPLEKEAVYFRCNLVKIRGRRILDFQARITKDLIKKIEKTINRINLNIDFEFKFTKGHRAVLIFRGKKFSDAVTNTNPVYIPLNHIGSGKLSKALPRPPNKSYFIKSSKPLKKTKEAIFTAKKINEFTKKTLKVLKPYGLGIILRGASKLGLWFQSLKKSKKYSKWALVSEMPVEIAIGKILGMKIFDYYSDYRKLSHIVLKLLRTRNVYLQIKGPDSYGHRGDYLRKTESIEKIDKQFLSPLVENLVGRNVLLIITCDHITSSKHYSHYKGPTTFIKTNLNSLYKDKKYKILNFSEKECKKKKIIKPSDLIKV